MPVFAPFRKSRRSLEDIIYPKDSYFSSKPLPILDRQAEIMLTEVRETKNVDNQFDSAVLEMEQFKTSKSGKKSIDITEKLNKSKSNLMSNRLKGDISSRLQQMCSASGSVKL